MFITLMSKILGFGRDITLSYFYGASSISDAYLIAQTIPSVLFGFIGAALTTAYIPMQNKIESSDGLNAGNRYTSNLINAVVLVTGFIFMFAFYFAEEVVKLFASGFYGETLKTATAFTRISLLGMFFTALIAIYSGFLQIRGRFMIPALIGFPLNIITIVAIVASSKGNIYVLLIGTLVATASQLFMMLPSARKSGFRYKFVLDFKDPRMKETLLIALPVIIGVSVNQINILVDRTIASTITVGGISALNYAGRLNQFIQGLFVTSLIAVIYPSISRMIMNNNMDGLKKTIKESVIIVTIFVIPITIGSMLFANQIISILFGRGAFDTQAVTMTTSALFYYSIGMLGFGLREIISRGFYAMHDTKTPMINAAIGIVINIVLNIILSRYMGIGGLALATSISAIVTTLLLFWSLRKKIGTFGTRQISGSFLKILLASLIMGVFAKVSYDYLIVALSSNLALFISIAIGTLSYAIIIYFMKIDDVDVMVRLIKKKISRGAV